MLSPFRFLLLLLLCVVISPVIHAETEKPLPASLVSPPAGHVLDQAKILLPDHAESLSRTLTTAAKDDEVYVYLVTVSALGGRPINGQQDIEALANQLADAWVHDLIGSIVVFDDENGLMSIASSHEAENRFSAVEIESNLRQALKSAIHTGVSRDNLERTALTVTETLKKLKGPTVTSQHSYLAWGIGGFGGLVILLVILLVVVPTKKPASTP